MRVYERSQERESPASNLSSGILNDAHCDGTNRNDEEYVCLERTFNDNAPSSHTVSVRLLVEKKPFEPSDDTWRSIKGRRMR